MIVRLTRFMLMTAGVLGALVSIRYIDWSVRIGYPQYIAVSIMLVLGVSMGYLLGGILGRELTAALARAERRLLRASPAELTVGTIGLLLGLLIGSLIGLPLRLLEPAWLAGVSLVALLAMSGHFGVRVAIARSGDITRMIPRLAEPNHQRPKPAVEPSDLKLFDTSAIIDGRASALRALGVIEGQVRVPRFVLAELHALADSADDKKRARGRRGLDFLASDASAVTGATQVFEVDYPEIPDVDGKLVRLAADAGGVIVTVDHNLTMAARAQGVGVINLNEVAAATRPAHLPGEVVRLMLSKVGKERTQGVGYLEDGTMVVVTDGSDYVGQEVDAEVTSVLQTSTGRMVFARHTARSCGEDG